jgi:hypothetical protein
MKATLRELRRARRSLKDELETSDDLMDLVDNFEIVANALVREFMPKKANRAYSLDKVLRSLAKVKHKEKPLLKRGRISKTPWWKLAAAIENIVDDIRAAEYGGWEDEADDMVSDANDIREQVFDLLGKLVQEATARAA